MGAREWELPMTTFNTKPRFLINKAISAWLYKRPERTMRRLDTFPFQNRKEGKARISKRTVTIIFLLMPLTVTQTFRTSTFKQIPILTSWLTRVDPKAILKTNVNRITICSSMREEWGKGLITKVKIRRVWRSRTSFKDWTREIKRLISLAWDLFYSLRVRNRMEQTQYRNWKLRLLKGISNLIE